MEWQVLQAVAAQHADPKVELARLVANLGFNKRKPQEGRLQSPVDFIGWGLGDGSRPCIGMDGREA